jgi:hypothetical protein
MIDNDLPISWAAYEFGNADLGDKRRTARLMQLAEILGEHPSASLPEAAGNAARLKAAYRFFDNDAITCADMLGSHIIATCARMRTAPLVLAVQDTTYLDWSAHPATQGLGPLSNDYQQGLLAHSSLAITPERVPLGVLAQQVWARDPQQFARQTPHKQRPIEDKESAKWLQGLESLFAARQACPDTHFVCVADREADIYDLFLVERPVGVDLLIRAAMNRRVEEEAHYLWTAVAQAPLATRIQIEVPRRGKQAARRALCAVRFCSVTLRPPRSRAKENLPSKSVWAVWVVEEQPPDEALPVEWLLLTTLAVNNIQDAIERIEWYTCRWGIEVFHKVLKSGCRIEMRQLNDAERLKRCLTLYSIIAWRILYATMLARALPDMPCTALLSGDEWQALYCAIHRVPIPPEDPPSLRQVVHWIAELGGFLGRKGDGEPGAMTLWKGFQRLPDLTLMFSIMRPSPGSKLKNVGKE